MSKIEELINEYCPNGVKFKKLEELLTYEQPKKYIVKTTKYSDEYKIPVLTAGQSFILGYTNEDEGIFNASNKKPVIIFDDFTTSFHWVDFNFKVKSSAIKILKPMNENVNLRYIYYAMSTIKYLPGNHARHWISVYSQFSVPVPPLEVQHEIVHILDDFTLLTAELTAELTARNKQYEYFKNKLLNIEHIPNVEVNEIGEICNIKAGGDKPKEIFSKIKNEEFNIPIIGNGIGKNAIIGYTNEAKISQKAVTIAARGTIGYAEYRDYSYFPIIRLISVIPKDEKILNTKYLYYCLKGRKYQTPKTGIPQLTVSIFSKTKILVPPLEEQERIVNILDRFDKLTNDINEGLPAEIETRRKQYEYYRDKLLNFKELVNE